VLADRDLVDYDAPVACYWPEFAANGKEHVTVRHVLTHSAGLHRLRSTIGLAEHMLDWEHMTAAFAAAPAAYEPGTRHGYHALTYGWLVGESERTARLISERQRTGADLVLVAPMDWRLGYHRSSPRAGRCRRASATSASADPAGGRTPNATWRSPWCAVGGQGRRSAMPGC